MDVSVDDSVDDHVDDHVVDQVVAEGVSCTGSLNARLISVTALLDVVNARSVAASPPTVRHTRNQSIQATPFIATSFLVCHHLINQINASAVKGSLQKAKSHNASLRKLKVTLPWLK